MHRLAARLEVEDRVANLLDLAPVRRGEPGHLDEHALDPIVGLGLEEVLDDAAHGRWLRGQIAEDVGRLDLAQPAAEVQRQRRMPRHGRLTAHHEVQKGDSRNRDDDCDAEQTEYQHQGAPVHGHVLVDRV
jgi:hypothetical protein